MRYRREGGSISPLMRVLRPMLPSRSNIVKRSADQSTATTLSPVTVRSPTLENSPGPSPVHNAPKVSCGPVHAQARQPCYTNLVQLLPGSLTRPTASPPPLGHLDSHTKCNNGRRSPPS